MSIASYIINFDELAQYITKSINESDIQLTVGDVTLDSSSISINTDKIDEILKSMSTKLNRVSDNTLLINDTVKNIIENITISSTNRDAYLKELDQKLSSIITNSLDIYNLVKKINDKLLSNDGFQTTVGNILEVPSSDGKFTKRIKFDKDYSLAGVSISQSAWNNGDYWLLKIGDITIFNNIYTKLQGEYKKLYNTIPVPKGSEIVLEYNNPSGNSKSVWFDYELLEIKAD
ncbi:hypothetical protein Bp8pS_130 [Bacillus phage vB_BpuM-BpSp]|nr:hypothetical protein Bp8pS_130 [Bacillus phage vB_BpuM-BpSp]